MIMEVSLSPEEALLLVQLEKRKALMNIIEEAGGFDIKSGHITIHFDGNGVVGSVEVHRRFAVSSSSKVR